MNFSFKFSFFLLLTSYRTLSRADKHLNCTSLSSTSVGCPVNAICSAVNGTTKNFRCTCLPNYVWNPLWQEAISGSNANTTNNINASNNKSFSNQFNILNSSTNATSSAAYCLSIEETNATQTANGKVYVRQPAKVEHLAFGILMVLFVAIAAISLLYLLKYLRPIKRSKAVYTQLRRRRENRERLEEFCDDISMIELNEKR